MTKPPLILLMGPTASGKTDLAIELCQQLPLDIISVDSAMVYRGMDIGTAKPSAEELAKAPHRLIDICDPDAPYSVGDFYADAQREIANIQEAGRTPLLVGGTMMYFKALLDGLADMPAADEKVRTAIEAEAAENGWPSLHQQLQGIDPEYAQVLHPNHSQRIARALEVYRVSGKTMTQVRREQDPSRRLSNRFQVMTLALWPDDRSWLHQRIEQRFSAMLTNGFVDEVKHLQQRYSLHAELPSMRAVGYRQVWQYLESAKKHAQEDSLILKKTLHETGVAATRQLAKRQLTWLRRWPDSELISAQHLVHKKIVEQVLNFLPTKSL